MPRMNLQTEAEQKAFAPGSGFEHLVSAEGEFPVAHIDLTDEVGQQAYRRIIAIRREAEKS